MLVYGVCEMKACLSLFLDNLIPSAVARGIRRSRRTEGGALVEMAVTLPLLLIIMTGIFSVSVAMYQKLLLTEAVSTGGRYLAADRGIDVNPCTATSTAIQNAAPTLAAGSFSITYTLNGVASGSTCNGTSNLVAGKSAQINVTYPCTLMWYGTTKSFGGCTLGAQIVEQVQ
jgi:Flp pilus assembly protein TadG